MVVDQDSETLELVKDFRDFRCDYLYHQEGFVMWQTYRWGSNKTEPTNKKLSTR